MSSNTAKHVLAFQIAAGLFFSLASLAACGEPAISSRLPLRGEGTRRVISTSKPMFHFHINMAYKDHGGDVEDNLRLIEDLWRMLPADIRNYFVFHVYGGWANPREAKHRYFEKLNELGMYFTSHGYDTSPAQIEKLFQEHEFYLGTFTVEIGCESGAIEKTARTLPDYLALSERYGGYALWGIQGMHDVLTSMAERYPGHFELMKRHSDRFILGHRNNSIGKTFTGHSEVLGSWLAGHSGHWWFNGQYWAWHEAGFTFLFGEEARERTQPNSVALMYPESLMGLEWVEAAALGATVFSLEAGDHVYSSRDGRRLTPGFKHVMLPLMRKMITEDLIPAREEVLSHIPAAYARSHVHDRHCAGSKIVAPLYGPRYDDHKEWMPSTGRYLRLPIIQSKAGTAEADRRLFETVFEEDDMPTGYDAVGWFNDRHARRGSGNAWSVRMKNRWFIANPNINQDIKAAFEVPLDRHATAVSLAGVFTPHTFAIVHDDAESIDIHLSNYRIDAKKDVWQNAAVMSNDLWEPVVTDYVNHHYCVNPTDHELRESVLSLRGLSAAPRVVSITGGEPGFERPFEHRADWDDENNAFTLRIMHNGPVDLKLDTAGIASVPTSANLALQATVRASSHASLHTIPDNAIDGNDRSSRWQASSEPSDASDSSDWLQVDFRTPKAINRIVLKEYLDRITDYRLDCRAGDQWRELARGTTIGPRRTHEFPALTTEAIRLRILQTKTDSLGQGNAPSLHAVEVFGDEPGIMGTYPAAASDVYEAEEDAVLSGGVERITGRAYFYRTYGTGLARMTETQKPRVTFVVTAPEAGNYRIGLRYSRSNWFDTGDGRLGLYVNGRFAAVVGLPETAAWDHWNMSSAFVTLSKGVNTIEYRNEADHWGVCLVDHIQLTLAEQKSAIETTAPRSVIPEHPLFTGRRWYDGGSAHVSGMAALATASPGYRGTGYAQVGAQAGDRAEIDVQVPKAGYYSLAVRHGVPPGWTWRDSTAHIYVGDRKAARVTALTRTPGRWLLENVLLYLEQGQNRVAFTVDAGDSGALLIDGLLLSEQPREAVNPVTGIHIEGDGERMPINGHDRHVTAVLVPEAATIQAVTWTTSDPSIVSIRPVTKDGSRAVIKGHKPGAATVRAVASDRGQTAEREIVVLPKINIASEATVSIDAPTLSQWLRQCAKNLVDGDLRETDCWHLGNDPQKPLPAHRIRLEWDRPRPVKTIVLYGRVAAGFSKGVVRVDDGSEILFRHVQGEEPVLHEFETQKNIAWLELEVLETRQWHAGLREIEVWCDVPPEEK